jgi:hypothetical protein
LSGAFTQGRAGLCTGLHLLGEITIVSCGCHLHGEANIPPPRDRDS